MTVLAVIAAVLFGLLYLREWDANRRLNRELVYVTKRIGELMSAEGDGYVLLPSTDWGIRELTAQLNRLLERFYRQRAEDRRARLAMMQVLTNISHDLRTPLTVLKGYSELLAGRMKKRDLQKVEKMAAKIEEKTDELVTVIEQYFTMSKLESGDMCVALQRIELTGVCREVMLEYYDILEKARYEVEIQVGGEPVFVCGDEAALIRILKNLIENAIKHGGDGRFLGIRLQCFSGETVIEVEDHGKGIADREQELVFDRNYTTARKGSGLGLAIARELALRMGAELQVESEPGVRTLFRVIFTSASVKHFAPSSRASVLRRTGDADRRETLEKS